MLRSESPDVIFISHAARDASLAATVVEALEHRGARCWIAPRDIDGGAVYAEAIMAAIARARACVVLLTDASVNSAHVLREIDRAQDLRIRIVPVIVGRVSLPSAIEYYTGTTQRLIFDLTPSADQLCRLVASVLNDGADTGSQSLVGAGKLLPGRLLAGRYELIRRIGEGGQGEVWEASDRIDAGARYALKIAHQSAPGSSDDRLRREAARLRLLTHEGIVRVFNIEQDADFGAYFIVMELVAGESLKALLNRSPEGRLQITAALTLARQLAEALDYAHARGVVHCDVKPSNILIERATGRAKLVDFGIAGGGLDGPATGLLGGTPGYMSPQAREGSRGPADDVYSFSVVLREALGGEAAEPPAAVAGVLRRGSDADPACRPASAGNLVAELIHALGPPHAPRELKPRIAAVAIYVGGPVTLAAILAGWLMTSVRATTPRAGASDHPPVGAAGELHAMAPIKGLPRQLVAQGDGTAAVLVGPVVNQSEADAVAALVRASGTGAESRVRVDPGAVAEQLAGVLREAGVQRVEVEPRNRPARGEVFLFVKFRPDEKHNQRSVREVALQFVVDPSNIEASPIG